MRFEHSSYGAETLTLRKSRLEMPGNFGNLVLERMEDISRSYRVGNEGVLRRIK
jgi:hypothetical protein